MLLNFQVGDEFPLHLGQKTGGGEGGGNRKFLGTAGMSEVEVTG